MSRHSRFIFKTMTRISRATTIFFILLLFSLTVFAQGTGGSITPGQSKNGTITGPGQSDQYTLIISQGGLYTITMNGTSEGMDCYLRLNGAGVNMENDDGGGNLNSRIVTQLNPGTYTIGAGTFGESSGSYVLSVQSAQSRTITVGQTVTGTIPSPGGSDMYSLTLTAPMAITIRMNAAAGGEMGSLDTFLELSGNGVSQQDDDGGGGLNSMISMQLEAGTYTITCHGFGESTGGYTLTLTPGLTSGGDYKDGNYDNQPYDYNQ